MRRMGGFLRLKRVSMRSKLELLCPPQSLKARAAGARASGEWGGRRRREWIPGDVGSLD